MRGGAAHAEAAYVDGARAAGDVRDHATRNDDARIGAELAGRVFYVFPGEARSAGHDVVIQENKRLGRIDAEPFEVGRGSVAVNVIDADKPGIFGVGDGEPPASSLVAGVRAGHVVGDGAQVAGFREVQCALFFGEDVAADEQPAIFHAMDVLSHFALAAAGGAFMHEDELVLVGVMTATAAQWLVVQPSRSPMSSSME